MNDELIDLIEFEIIEERRKEHELAEKQMNYISYASIIAFVLSMIFLFLVLSLRWFH